MELEKEDAVISEFLRSIGPWSNHIVIGGGYALIISTLYNFWDLLRREAFCSYMNFKGRGKKPTSFEIHYAAVCFSLEGGPKNCTKSR